MILTTFRRFAYKVPQDADNEEVLDFLARAFKSGFWTFEIAADHLDDHEQLKPYAKWLVECGEPKETDGNGN